MAPSTGDASTAGGSEVRDLGDVDQGSTDRHGADVDQGSDGDGDAPHDALPFQSWIKRSASGAVLSGIALGLQQVFQPRRELPAFVMEAPGEPEDDDAPITLHFDPDDPTKTVAVVRTPRPGPSGVEAGPPSG